MIRGTPYENFIHNYQYYERSETNELDEEIYASNMWKFSEFSLEEDTKEALLQNPGRITNKFVKEFAKQQLRAMQHELNEPNGPNARDVSNAVVVSGQAGLPSDIARKVGEYLFGKRK